MTFMSPLGPDEKPDRMLSNPALATEIPPLDKAAVFEV